MNLPYLLFLLLFLPSLLLGQASEEAAERRRLNQAMSTLLDQRADVIFPGVVKKIRSDLKKFEKSEPDFSSVDHSVHAVQLVSELQSWISTTERVRPHLLTLIGIRDRAQKVDASEFSGETFQQADLALGEAAMLFLRESNKAGRNKVLKAERLYLKAEREAIRNSLLGQVRILLLESEDLNARKFSPKSLSETRRLLTRVEKQLDRGGGNQVSLSQNSLTLLHQARLLLRRVKQLNQIYADPENGEAFLLALEEETQKASDQFQIFTPPEASIVRQLSDVNQSIETIIDEQNQLSSQLEIFHEERLALEKELLQYRNVHEWNDYVALKVARIKAELGDIVSEEAGFLTLTLAPFRFEGEDAQLNAEQHLALSQLNHALREFPEQTVLIRYFQSVYGNPVFTSNLAHQRAAAVQDYLSENKGLKPQKLRAIGINTMPTTPSLDAPGDYLQIMIDLDTILGLAPSKSSGETE